MKLLFAGESLCDTPLALYSLPVLKSTSPYWILANPSETAIVQLVIPPIANESKHKVRTTGKDKWPVCPKTQSDSTGSSYKYISMVKHIKLTLLCCLLLHNRWAHDFSTGSISMYGDPALSTHWTFSNNCFVIGAVLATKKPFPVDLLIIYCSFKVDVHLTIDVVRNPCIWQMEAFKW